MKILISDIKFSRRIRKDIGNITRLKDSIESHGLLQPVIINQNNELLAGYRRIEAAKKLGWKEVEVTVVRTSNRLDSLNIELEENLFRKEFTFEEIRDGMRLQQKLKRHLSRPSIIRFVARIFDYIIEFLLKLFGK